MNVLSAKGAAVAGLPVVVRLDGNGAAEGRSIVAQAALPGVQTAASVWQAVQAAVAAAGAGGGRRGAPTRRGPAREARRPGSAATEMAILVDGASRVVVQGVTGREGSFHTQRMLAAGTAVVAGTSPRKAGQTVAGVPVFADVAAAVAATGANVAVQFVPAGRRPRRAHRGRRGRRQGRSSASPRASPSTT